MDFSITKEQAALRQEIKAFADKEINPGVAERDRNSAPQRLVTLEIEAEDADASGFEPVWRGERRIGFITSGGYGHWVQKSLAFAYLAPDCAEPGTALEVMVLGQRRPARVLGQPVYDPISDKPRTDG